MQTVIKVRPPLCESLKVLDCWLSHAVKENCGLVDVSWRLLATIEWIGAGFAVSFSECSSGCGSELLGSGHFSWSIFP